MAENQVKMASNVAEKPVSAEGSFLKRALLLSVAVHLAFALVFPLMKWTSEAQYRSGEVLTLSHVQRITISHRARAVVARDVTHDATQRKKNVVFIPRIASARPTSEPVRAKREAARHFEAPARVIAAVAHVQSAPQEPSVGNVTDPAPIESASAPPAEDQPKQVAAVPTSPPQQILGGAQAWGVSEQNWLANEKSVVAFLKLRLGKVFHVRIHIAENGKPTDVVFIAPNIDEKTQAEIRAQILAEAHFTPKMLDGQLYESDKDLP